MNYRPRRRDLETVWTDVRTLVLNLRLTDKPNPAHRPVQPASPDASYRAIRQQFHSDNSGCHLSSWKTPTACDDLWDSTSWRPFPWCVYHLYSNHCCIRFARFPCSSELNLLDEGFEDIGSIVLTHRLWIVEAVWFLKRLSGCIEVPWVAAVRSFRSDHRRCQGIQFHPADFRMLALGPVNPERQQYCSHSMVRTVSCFPLRGGNLPSRVPAYLSTDIYCMNNRFDKESLSARPQDIYYSVAGTKSCSLELHGAALALFVKK